MAVFQYKHPLRATITGVFFGIMIWLSCHVFMESDSLRAATIATGRLSGLLFLLVFIARPLVNLFGTMHFGALLRQRPNLGLILAGNHHVHMVLLTILLTNEGDTLKNFLINPGLYIYFLLVLMNLTSFPRARKIVKLDTINRIHLIGIYVLAIAFFETLVLSVLLGEEGGVFRITYSVLFFLALSFRMVAMFRNQKGKSALKN